MTKIVFLPTVHHTGTHFMESLLGYSCLSHSLLQIGNYKKDDKFYLILIDNDGKIVPIGSYDGLPEEIRRRASSNKNGQQGNHICLVHSHVAPLHRAFVNYDCIRLLARGFSCVIPVRDPLKAVMTAVVRFRDDVKRWFVKMILDGFTCLSRLQLESSKHDCFWFPVDIISKLPVGGRAAYLERLFRFLTIDVVPDHLEEYSCSWPHIGSWEDFGKVRSYPEDYYRFGKRLFKYHDDGDLDSISRLIPKTMISLKEREPVIRPFLESLGYKNLIWWS